MKRTRKGVTNDIEFNNSKKILMFKNADYPDEKYNFLHPVPVTVGCNMLIIIKNQGGTKPDAIPVHKEFMMAEIDYFKREHDKNSNWRENTQTSEKVWTWEVPHQIAAQSVLVYILRVYQRSLMSEEEYGENKILNKTNCLEILQLADFLCDDIMKQETLEFVENNIDSDLVIDIFDNFGVQALLKDTARKFIKQNEKVKSSCNLTEIASVYQFFTHDDSKFCTKKENRILSVQYGENWETAFTGPIPDNSETFQLNFRIKLSDVSVYQSIRIGIVDSEAFEDEDSTIAYNLSALEEYQFSGFQLNTSSNKNIMVSWSGMMGETVLSNIPISHQHAPAQSFKKDESFTLTYTRKKLSITNTRGLTGSVKIDDTADKYRFFFTMSQDEKMRVGAEIEILPAFTAKLRD